ncbi:FmdB family zinc ribbon protein [Tsukamurella paurometabola]|uniref:Regulatory protein, FmdB family n=1 Tax=Tsukamurella paurometabola (strain ATCC 8368 / DSM 20162 / CCUG 35730 / CIP 100753 / JCM 10117 / KCTC 9821 / NBRC 16120 / NCIMB 702349 / NCTC 13040) TaxID=521096 RepID=D5UM60_TSUPD|nr:FmdB family zinc ribbon protein [Tsukamurella paurometabola]ADG78340.1 regulatory protein, FmdB family [Tsukamurella paurometabola DSM 20162]
MPTYEFRCRSCGPFDAVYSMREVPDSAACTCGAAAPRGITAPRLGSGATSAIRLIDATRATAERPAVVSAPPRRAGGGAPSNPRHAALPRP